MEYKRSKSKVEDLLEHFLITKNDFIPPLDETVDLNKYSQKILDNAVRFECWSGDILVGLIAIYLNNFQTKVGYITSVSVSGSYKGKGIAKKILNDCFDFAQRKGFKEIKLEVHKNNENAIGLYKKVKFVKYDTNEDLELMKLELKNI